MSDKTLIDNAILGLTQKIQMHFPRDIDPSILKKWNGCSKEVLAAKLEDVFGKMPDDIMDDLLESIGIIAVPASTSNLSVRDHIANLKSNGAKIFTGSNFESWFFGKKMKPASESELQCYKLRQNSVDDSIIAKLGGKKKAESTIEDFFSLIEAQLDGRVGTLAVDGNANIFYIRDAKGELRAVFCYWLGFEWYLHAYEVDYPHEWDAGTRVFSRNFSEN